MKGAENIEDVQDKKETEDLDYKEPRKTWKHRLHRGNGEREYHDGYGGHWEQWKI